MKVRAKMKCTQKIILEGGVARVELKPVTCGSAENESFYKWTPSGTVDLQVLNSYAAAKFEPGTEYYIDFTPVEEERE